MSSTVGLSRGLPSTGCNNCRSRKVKCDEARPACARCARTGAKDCEYRDRFALAWRDQTEFASERAKKTWRKRAKGKAAADADAAAAAANPSEPSAAAAPKPEVGFTSVNSAQAFRGFMAVNSGSGWGGEGGGDAAPAAGTTSPGTSATVTPVASYASSVASASLSPQSAASSLSPLSVVATPPAHAATPAMSFEQRVLQRFFFDWTISDKIPKQTPDSFFPFLPVIFDFAPKGSIFREAALTLAYANYDARLVSPEATEHAIGHYGNVIKLLKDLMQKATTESKVLLTTHAMLSVILLGMYETMVAPNLEVNGGWSMHTSGVSAMLITAVAESPDVSIPPPLYALIITQLLTNSVLRGRALKLPGPVRQKLSSMIEDPQVNLQYELIYPVAELCGEWKPVIEAYIDGTPGSIEKLKEIVARAVEADRNLHEWTLNLSLDWNYHIVGVEKERHPEFMWPLLEGDWFPSASQCYDSLIVEIKWRLHFAMKLILNHALLFTIDALEKAGESMDLPVGRQAVEDELINLIDRICESCLASFLTPLLNKPKPTNTEEICSARGYMLLQTLPAVWMCVSQAPFASYDTSGRLQWVTKMLEFLGRKIGFAKGTSLAMLPGGASMGGRFSQHKYSLQLWGAEKSAEK